jgi:hypothetical protein
MNQFKKGRQYLSYNGIGLFYSAGGLVSGLTAAAGGPDGSRSLTWAVAEGLLIDAIQPCARGG